MLNLNLMAHVLKYNFGKRKRRARFSCRLGRRGPLEPTAARTAPRHANRRRHHPPCFYSRRYPTFYTFESLPFLATTLFSLPLPPRFSLTNGDVHRDAKRNRPLRRPEARDLGPQEEGARLISFFFLVLHFESGLYSWYSYRFFGDLVFLLCVGDWFPFGWRWIPHRSACSWIFPIISFIAFFFMLLNDELLLYCMQDCLWSDLS